MLVGDSLTELFPLVPLSHEARDLMSIEDQVIFKLRLPPLTPPSSVVSPATLSSLLLHPSDPTHHP
jgi:hypothetical protein